MQEIERLKQEEAERRSLSSEVINNLKITLKT